MNKFKVGDEVLIVKNYDYHPWIEEQFEKGLEVRGILVEIGLALYSVQLPKECTAGHSCGGVIPEGYVGWGIPPELLAPAKPLAILEEIE